MVWVIGEEATTMYASILSRVLSAVAEAMAMIRDGQLQGPLKHADVKDGDATLVTAMDHRVERFLRDKLRDLRNVCLIGAEESGYQRTATAGELLLLIDPLDGTRAFASGIATSTVIVAAVHPPRGVVLCVVGEPSTGRVWFATEEDQTRRWMMYGDATSPLVPVEVWNGELAPHRTVLMDMTGSSVRDRREVLDVRQAHELVRNVSSHAKVLVPGSNGLNFALVANGGTNLVGQISTAVGGAWDVAGLLLVLQAGGYVRAFRTQDRRLIERDPRHILRHDIVVSGNSRSTVDRLVDLVERTF